MEQQQKLQQYTFEINNKERERARRRRRYQKAYIEKKKRGIIS